MTALTVVPTTGTISGWLIIAGLALLFLTLVTGLGEWLAHCRREQTSIVPRPNWDDLARALGDEREQARIDWQRIEAARASEERE